MKDLLPDLFSCCAHDTILEKLKAVQWSFLLEIGIPSSVIIVASSLVKLTVKKKRENTRKLYYEEENKQRKQANQKMLFCGVQITEGCTSHILWLMMRTCVPRKWDFSNISPPIRFSLIQLSLSARSLSSCTGTYRVIIHTLLKT